MDWYFSAAIAWFYFARSSCIETIQYIRREKTLVSLGHGFLKIDYRPFIDSRYQHLLLHVLVEERRVIAKGRKAQSVLLVLNQLFSRSHSRSQSDLCISLGSKKVFQHRCWKLWLNWMAIQAKVVVILQTNRNMDRIHYHDEDSCHHHYIIHGTIPWYGWRLDALVARLLS